MGVAELKHGESHSELGPARHAFMFTDVCACEIRRREVHEACRCACPDGIAPSKVSTSSDACDDDFLISAKSVTLNVSTIVRVHVHERCLTQSLGL